MRIAAGIPSGSYPPALSEPCVKFSLRGLAIDRPNHVWCADITFIPVNRGFLNLMAIMGWANRYVLAWRLLNTLDTGSCVEPLDDALDRHGRPEIFNTDQGSQFTSFAFSSRLQAAGIRISMVDRGRFMDSIFIERLWRSLKYEAIYLHEIADGFAAQRRIADWVHSYNVEGPHAALDGRTLAEAYRNETPVDMMDKSLFALLSSHRRNSSNRMIESRAFQRPKKQPEYTVPQPLDCPNRRGHFKVRCS